MQSEQRCGRVSRLVHVIIQGVLAIGLLGSPQHVDAQIWTEWSVQLHSKPVVTTRVLKELTESLNLSEDQQRAVEELVAAYQAEHASLLARTEEVRGYLDFDSYDGLAEPGEWYQQSYTMRRESLKKSDGLFDSFLSDMNEVVGTNSPAVAEFERRLRRERLGRSAGWRNSIIPELRDLIQQVRPKPEIASAIEPVLLNYEAEYDKELQKFAAVREKYYADWDRIIGKYTGDTATVPQSVRDSANELQSFTGVLNGLRRRHLDLVQAAVPPELREEFDDQINRRLFPRLYVFTRVNRVFAAALTLSDLDSGTVSVIKEMHEAYKRERADVDRVLLSVEIDAHRAQCFGQNNPDAYEAKVRAVEARQSMEKKTLERLYTLLGTERREAVRAIVQRAEVNLDLAPKPKPE